MKTKLLLSAAAIATAFTSVARAQSDWQASVGLMQFKEDEIRLEGAYATLGYRIEASPNFFVIPELTLGTGISEDRYFGTDVEISHFISLGARAQYEFDSGLYLYGQVAWGDLEVDTTFGSGSTDEVGAGAGIGYDFNERIGAEFSYGVFDETDVLQLGLKFKF